MKLALIRRQFSATGGAELYAQRLMSGLLASGHQVHLFAESWSNLPEAVSFHPVAADGSRAERPLRFAQEVGAAIEREGFDCVFSLEPTLRQDVYRAGDGVHRVWLERRREFAPRWRKQFIGIGSFHRNMVALEARTFDAGNTRHVIVNSDMVRREIERHFGFPPRRIHLVRNGVDVSRFATGNRLETRKRFGVKDDDFLLLFVGSGWERKGLRFILRAIKTLADPKLKLLVVGKDRLRPYHGADACFAGAMNQVENAYAAADLFVFLPIYEPSANVCIEALAAGLPVITSATNGASEVICEGINGTVVQDPADISAVSRAIREWQTRAARPVTTTFDLSIERNVAETLRVLELAAAEKRA
jgi:UDP-glucose:(heptosyl)LPS alpha-1,3-glucosyltransferase